MLREDREKLLGFKVSGEKRSQEYLRNTQTERQKIMSEFQQLRQFLKEQERLLLAQLEKLDKEIVKIQNENVSKVSEEISRLSDLISELEGKCQKPVSELLQDVRSTLSRYVALSHSSSLFSMLGKSLEMLHSAVCTGDKNRRIPRNIQRGVTLDPDTAHPELVLSENGKSLIRADTRQRLPNNPDRFDTRPCVLGCEGFTSGRHCWEVEVGDGQYWAVGVARESVRRKGGVSLSPEGGIWAVGWWLSQFRALTSPVTPLPRRRVPSRIRVCLDCDRRQVTFIDAGDEALIFTFPPGSIPGERIRPWLWLVWVGSRLRLCP
nr:zinc finger protein RFP-like [Chrysemys picta bellii]